MPPPSPPLFSCTKLVLASEVLRQALKQPVRPRHPYLGYSLWLWAAPDRLVTDSSSVIAAKQHWQLLQALVLQARGELPEDKPGGPGVHSPEALLPPAHSKHLLGAAGELRFPGIWAADQGGQVHSRSPP